MSYIKKIEYEVVPQESFSVIRNCPGCGVKTNYRNTKRFRVNANGNRLDVWLIYQCEKCKHALNLTVYERQKAAIIPKDEYQHFLSNDEETAEKYGMNFDFFRKNKADVDMDDITYRYIKLQESSSGPADKIACHEQTLIHIQNPYDSIFILSYLMYREHYLNYNVYSLIFLSLALESTIRKALL